MAATKPNEVDVLIIGAGPSGLMLALWMARLGVKARIVDKRTAKIFSGQADGYSHVIVPDSKTRHCLTP